MLRKLRAQTSSRNAIETPCMTRIRKSHNRTAPRSAGTKLMPEGATVSRYFDMKPQSVMSMTTHTKSGRSRARLPRKR
jgi:hypothetical protein